jgi:hypothetical protein
MVDSQIDGNRPAQRVAVNEAALRRTTQLSQQITPAGSRILVHPGLIRFPATALAVAAVIDHQHAVTHAVQPYRSIDIMVMADILVIAMQVEQRRRAWLFRWNPPAIKLATVASAAGRDAHHRILHACAFRRGLQLRRGFENQLALDRPQVSAISDISQQRHCDE